jgi:hypothetical protein
MNDYEGVPRFNVYLLRLLFALTLLFVGSDSWGGIVRHHGPWDPVRAAAVCMWAGYSLLSLFGIFRPLRWLPIVLFEIVYKTTWLIVVAWPLWRANALWGTPAGEMAAAFLWLPLALIATPWKYVFETYVFGPKKAAGFFRRGVSV